MEDFRDLSAQGLVVLQSSAIRTSAVSDSVPFE